MMRPALFLDRDGIVNVDHGYVVDPAAFVWCDGIFALARAAHDEDMAVVIVTNQSGIARGYYSEAQYSELTDWMCAQFSAEGAPIAAVYHCPYHPEALLPHYRSVHPWRKPAPGMLFAARDALGLDLPNSFLVGDQWSDIAAARAAGVGHALLVGDAQREACPKGLADDATFASVAAVARWFATRNRQDVTRKR